MLERYLQKNDALTAIKTTYHNAQHLRCDYTAVSSLSFWKEDVINSIENSAIELRIKGSWMLIGKRNLHEI